jgi:hypothetical protein
MNMPIPSPASPSSGKRRSSLLAALLLVGVVALLLSGSGALALQDDSEETEPPRKEFHGDVIQIFTGDVRVPADTIRYGTIVCIGGDVIIEGEVSQDVTVILGSLTIDGGRVRHSVFGILSKLELRDAEIRRDLFNIGGGMEYDDIYVGGQQFDLGILGSWFPGFLTVMTWLRVLGLLFTFILLVLLVAIAPDRVRLIGDETPVRYVSAFFVGILVYCVLLLVVLPIAASTIIGLPVLYLAYLAFKWLALAGMFYAFGRRIGRGFGREMSPLGAVLLIYTFYSLILLALSPLGLVGLALISVFRTIFFCFFEVPAVGLVLLTRLGTRASSAPGGTGGYPGTSMAVPPAYPPPPMPPPAEPQGPPTDPSENRND